MMKKEVLSLSIIMLLAALTLTRLPMKVRAATQTPFFKLHLAIPTTMWVRTGWGTMIADEMKKIGIDSRPIYGGFDLFWPRCFELPAQQNLWEEGGYDALLFGMMSSVEFSPSIQFSKENVPLYNYYHYDNETNEKLIQEFESEINRTRRIELLHEWQRLYREEQPSIVVWQGTSPTLMSTKLEGVHPLTWLVHYGYPWYWTLGDPEEDATCVFALINPPNEFNGIISALGYDFYCWTPVYNSLIRWNSELNDFEPELATNWTCSEDGKHWVINLREGVTFHDGWPFNATDVKFTWDSIFNPDVGSWSYPVWEKCFGSTDAYRVTGEYQITVDLPEPFPFFESMVLFSDLKGGGCIIPWHVHKDIPPKEWRTHPSNTGIGTYEVKRPDGSIYIAHGPIGTGPYKFMGYDITERRIYLTQYEDYWRGRGGNIKDFQIVWISTPEAAVSAVKSGEVHILQECFYIGNKKDYIDPSWGKIESSVWPAHQELGFNFKSPIWGTGVDTPLGKKDPTRAAEAAKYIRQAIAHVIPREAILNDLMGGFGEIHATPMTSCEIGFDPTVPPREYDLEKAKMLMEKAGYSYEEEVVVHPIEAYLPYIAAAVVVVAVVVPVLYLYRKRAKK